MIIFEPTFFYSFLAVETDRVGGGAAGRGGGGLLALLPSSPHVSAPLGRSVKGLWSPFQR